MGNRFNYHSKKEIIKISSQSGFSRLKDGKHSESNKSQNAVNYTSDNAYWTGIYIFVNEWQSFRTERNPTLEFTSIAPQCLKEGKYQVMGKVVDILGIDTSKIIEVNIK